MQATFPGCQENRPWRSSSRVGTRRRSCARCLDSVAAQGDCEVFVVDNGSDDGTVELLRERGIPHLTLPDQSGFRRRRRPRRRTDPAPFVLPLNADTELEPGASRRWSRRWRPIRASVGWRRGSCRSRASGREVGAARLYSVGQALTARRSGGRDRRGGGPGRGDGGAARGLRRLRRRLPAAAGALHRARRLRRELLRLLRGRRPERAGADRRLAVRVRPRGGRLAPRQRLLAGGRGEAGGLERAPRRPQPDRHPGPLHARARRYRGSPRSRSGRSPAPPASGASSRPCGASWKAWRASQPPCASAAASPRAATSPAPAPGSGVSRADDGAGRSPRGS